LLGALYVESIEKCDFPEEEILLLRTISDVFAGAWHNALTFQKAQEQAITDGLTGVKTHRFLMEALSAEWKRSTRASRPFSLVLLDLDRFKFVNDFYGHLEGDVVLRRVAHILEQNCRRSDVVARYGGDEFVILMPETSVEQATQLASKLRSWVASDPLLRDKNITASFGIAGFPVHGSTPQELIQVADSSMYLSKHQGGNSVSSAEQHDPNEAKKWKHDVLEAYLGVTLKRLFTTGPEAFDEIYRRVEQFARSLGEAALWSCCRRQWWKRSPHWRSRSTPRISTPTGTRKKFRSTRWWPRKLPVLRRRRSKKFAWAPCCMTSARWASPSLFCTKRARSTRPSGRR
jgi:diguanylate cyclase (GGDEF)-like protein